MVKRRCALRVAEAAGVSRLLVAVMLANCALPSHAQPTPLWFDGAGLTQPALDLLEAMRTAEAWGLDPNDYTAAKLLSELQAADSPERRAQGSGALSTTALRFISHLHYGRVDPTTVGFDMPPRLKSFDSNAILRQLATTQEARGVLASIEPPFQHYALLKAQLANYRRLAAHPQLTQLPALSSPSIAAGAIYPGAPALRKLLAALGDMPPVEKAPDTDLSLDPQLAGSLRRFQFRHGLQQDGVLGKRTYAALTTPLAFRIRQIELTLERWRWLPALNAPTIIVNIPQFRLFAFATGSDRESQMLTMDVIVGQDYPRTRTPVFAGDMKFVVFRPSWEVPYGIMSREMLTHIRREPGYLVAHDLEIVNADDSAATTQHPTSAQIAALTDGKLRVRQRPGPQNSLGLVKFMLPNRYDVYLHSTPEHELFRESRRAFSHGCIRVGDPVALAEYILRNAPGAWPRERIEAAMQGSETLRVDLEQPVRVLIVYGTAVATEGGLIYFFDDLYGNDAQLADVLRHRRNPFTTDAPARFSN